MFSSILLFMWPKYFVQKVAPEYPWFNGGKKDSVFIVIILCIDLTWPDWFFIEVDLGQMLWRWKKKYEKY